MGQSFLESVRDYLNERLKSDELYGWRFKPFEIDVPSPLPKGKWMIYPRFPTSPIGSVVESIDGTISVYSSGIDKAGEYIAEYLIKSYRRRFERAEAKGKEEEEKVWKAFEKEKSEARRDYINRRNIEKHLKKSYRDAFIRLLWFEEACERISREYRVEVKVEIVNEIECDTYLASRFNGSSKSEEEKFEEIRKRVEAIIAAYKLAMGAYKKRFPSELEKGNYKKYQEFRKSILEKYGLKKRKLKI